MNINLQDTLHNSDFQPFTIQKQLQGGQPAPVPVTVGMVINNSLLNDGDVMQPKPSIDSRLERYNLAERINMASNVMEFTMDEIALIRSCVGQFQPIVVLGQIFKILAAAA
jgi:hypothetical protein